MGNSSELRVQNAIPAEMRKHLPLFYILERDLRERDAKIGQL
jgi:hypothetical protein